MLSTKVRCFVLSFAEKKPFAWQEECLNRWLESDGKGIVHAVTGAGKTFFALKAITALKNSPLLAANTPLRVKIVAPKTFLARQWANALKEELQAASGQIGYYYGGYKEQGAKDYMVYVVNSARHALSRHILQDLRGGCAVLLIADECHHYGSEENSRIFDFYPYLSGAQRNFFALGLSATPEIPAGSRDLEPYLGKEIYEYSFAQALGSNIVSNFKAFGIGVDFTPDELADYTEFSDAIARSLSRLKKLRPALRKADACGFFAALQRLALDTNAQIASLARGTLGFIYQRREVVYLAQERIPCVLDLVARLAPDAKIIVFGERIEAADLLYRELCAALPGQVGRYHSGMSDTAKSAALERYQNGEIRILVSCKALDEGLNVPQTDVGIVLSETSSSRQKIQRLGRILRKTVQNRTACLYTLFVRESNRADEDSEGVEAVELFYDSTCKSFTCPYYDALCATVCAHLAAQNTAEALLLQVRRNMRLGIVRADYLLTAEDAAAMAAACTTRHERNYWVTMQLIVRARGGELR